MILCHRKTVTAARFRERNEPPYATWMQTEKNDLQLPFSNTECRAVSGLAAWEPQMEENTRLRPNAHGKVL